MSPNLRLRLITAAGLLALFLAALFMAPDAGWSGFVALFIAGAAWEWAGLIALSAGLRAIYVALTLPALGLAAMNGLATNIWSYTPLLAFWFGLVPLWLMSGWGRPARLLGALLGWLLLLPSALALLYLREQSPFLVLVAVGVAVVADTAAYFAGRAYGRRKLAPRISPGKTLEGALAAGIAVLAYAFMLSLSWRDSCGPACTLTILAAFLMLFLASVLGDLFESWIKRLAGVKDSGNLLPGHGGVLDRMDSLTAVLPVAAFFWMVFR
jgi:phosphatidate cytidylyltransferase